MKHEQALLTFLGLCLLALPLQAREWSKEEIQKKQQAIVGERNPLIVQQTVSRQGGNDPFSAVVIPGLPFGDVGDTNGLNNNSGGFTTISNLICPIQGYYVSSLTGFGPDTWYSFNLPQQETIFVDLCNSSYDTSVGIFQQTGLPLQPGDLVAANDDNCGLASQLQCTLPQGDYLLCVSGWQNSAGVYDLFMDLGTSEDCSTFEALLCGDYLEGTTEGFPNLLGNSAPDYFYNLTINEPAFVHLSTCDPATNFDTYLRVYEGCPFQGGPEIANNDDSCDLQSEIFVYLQPGDYLVQVEGFSNSSGDYVLSVNCQPGPLSIPQIYETGFALLGQEIPVIAYTTDDESNQLVDDWARFQVDAPYDEDFFLWVGESPILPEDQGGALIEAVGVLSLETDTPSGTDLRLDIVTYEVLTAAVPDAPWAAINWNIPAECDSCQFGLLFSGGLNAHNNHPRYWNNLADVYCMKRGEGYCEENLDVLYYRGTRGNNQIPAARVDTCTADKIKASLAAAAAKIGACKRAGKSPKLEVFITNHGDTVGGQALINLLDNLTLHPDSLTAWIQMAVDSGATALEVEATQCFGGGVVNSLRRKLARTDSCEVTAASATDSTHYARSKGGPGGYSRWGRPWVEGRRDSLSLQEAIRRANEAYDQRLRDTDVTEEVGKGQYYRSIPSSGRCDSMQVQVTPGGHIDVEFHGNSTNCGNCTVYCQRKSDNKYIKLKQWNWNIPGSAGFLAGQNKRRIDADTSGTGMYIIHNNNGPFRIEATSTNPAHGGGIPNRTTSPSNREEFAGFSMGWRNSSSAEFGTHAGATLSVDEMDSMSLGELPRILGTGGVAELTVNFDLPAQNPWWENMVLSLKVEAVSGSPDVDVLLPGANVSSQSAGINFPGEWVFPFGAIAGTGAHSLTIAVSGGSLEMDCWDIHSQLSTWPLLVVDLDITQSGDDILLSWSESPAAGSFRVESAPTPSGPWTSETTLGGQAWLDTGAAAAPSQKFYRVISVE